MFNNRAVVYKNISGLKIYSTALLILTAVLLAGGFSRSFGQWVNDPSINTRLVIDAADPIDISAVKDMRGGAFIFWQDNKNRFQGKVCFMHVDADGKISFRADGKQVSDLSGSSENPVCSASLPNSAVVVWKDITNSENGALYAQRVMNNGNMLWSNTGIKITGSKDLIKDYAVASDNIGNCFISVVSKGIGLKGSSNLKVQKLTAEGKKVFTPDSSAVYNSIYRISMPQILPDNKGGAFIFWLESKQSKTVILGQRIDSTGKVLWGKKPVEISAKDQSVISYSALCNALPGAYIVWQTQGKDKDIYHQLIGLKGKPQWAQGGKLIAAPKGNQVNPQAAASDSAVIVSWTNEQDNNRDIYIQKFNKKGSPLWKKPGIPVIKYAGEQFGQKIISDGSGGSIAAWIDRRVDSTYADIYVQRIDAKGNPMWDSLGIPAASNYNSPKSYLSLVSDDKGDALVLFKNKRDDKNELYGQKIFGSGTYVSQMISFNALLEGDSIKISWHSANERNNTRYTIERTVQGDTGFSNWIPLKTFVSSGSKKDSEYEYYDSPNVPGTLYYRVAQSQVGGRHEFSSVSKVNYFGSSSRIVVAQNTPNPFADSTIISFYLPKAAKVTVQFFDSHVERISETEKKEYPAGENQITFSAQGLKPGIYFYRFKANDFVEVKKMVITN